MKNLSTTRGMTLLVAIALVSAPVLAGSYAKKDIVDTWPPFRPLDSSTL
jgi:hypothetical protein